MNMGNKGGIEVEGMGDGLDYIIVKYENFKHHTYENATPYNHYTQISNSKVFSVMPANKIIESSVATPLVP